MAIEALINSALDRFRRCQGGIILTVLVLAFVTPSVSKCIVATDKLDRGAADTRASLPAELIRYFAGNWSGQGKFANSGKDLASDLSFVPDLGNQCIVVREKERAPNTFQFVALWSMDTVTG